MRTALLLLLLPLLLGCPDERTPDPNRRIVQDNASELATQIAIQVAIDEAVARNCPPGAVCTVSSVSIGVGP